MTLRRFALLYSFLLMLILIMVLLGYRQFVAMPKIEQGLAVFQDRELSTLQLALNKEISFLKTINYDYSVWKDAYEFIQEYDQEFIDDNFPSDTFTSLKIDGVFIFDDKFNQIWGKGFDYDKNRHFDLPELNLINFPHNQKLFPAMNSDNKVPQNSGFLNTSEGPVMFSATQARNSDRSGEPIGVVVFVRKIRPGLIKSLSEMSQLGLFSKEIKTTADATTAQPLKGSLQGENFAHKRQRLILDINNKPLILLNIEHYHS